MKKILLGAALGGVVAAGILIIAGVIFFRTRLPQFSLNNNPSTWMAQRATGGGMMDRWDADDNYGPGMMNRRYNNNNYAPGMMNPRFDRSGYGPGMMGRGFSDGNYGPGMMGGRFGGDGGPGGWMHDDMVAAVADKLSLSAEDLQGRLDKGETMYEVAASEGLSDEEFQTMIEEVHNAAIDKAVVDGKITQEQADWMKERSEEMGAFRRGNFGGSCPCLDDSGTDATPVPES